MKLACLAAVLLLAAAARTAAQTEGPDDLATLADLRADFARGGTWAAQRDLTEYLQEFPASPGANRLAAEVAFQRGQVAEAEARLRAGGWPDEELHGAVLLRAGRYEEALELSGKLTGLAGKWLAVQAKDALGQHIDALKLARESTARDDSRTLDGQGLLDLGRLLLFQRKFELANQAFVFADAELNGKQGPNYRLVEPEAPLLMARVRFETRQAGVEGVEPALRLVQEVLALDAGNPQALFEKALLHTSTQNGQAAEDALQAALRRDSTQPDVLLLLGMTRLLDRRVDAALELAARLLSVDPRQRDALALRAAALAVAGRPEAAAARTAFETAHPQSASLDLLLGSVLQQHYRFDESIAPLERALAIQPEDESPLPVLAQSLAHLGREIESRVALEEHQRRSPYPFPWRTNMLDVLAKLRTNAEIVTPGEGDFRLSLPQGEQDVLGPLLSARLLAAREDMAARWGVSPDPGVLVEVFDHHADFSVRTVGFEGLGALGACFGRVVTLLSPLCELRGNFLWSQTTVHEYAHVVTLTLSQQRIPRWLTEGLSVQEEKKANPGWARPLDRDVLDARANGRLLPVERLDESFRDGATIMLGYYQGSLLAEVIERDFGFDALRALVAAFADGRDTPAAIRAALQIEPTELDRRLLEYVDGVVAARAVIRPHFDTQGEKLARQRAQAGDADAWLDVAQACLGLGRRADADAALDRYLKVRGETPDALEELALRDLLDGRGGPAREKLERWAAQGRPNTDGLRALAELQLADGDKDLGLATLERARSLFPGEVGGDSAVARLLSLRRADGDDEAVAALLEVICDHDSTALEPRLTLARRALQVGQTAEGLLRLAEAAEIDPYRPDIRLEYADALLAAGASDAAREQWQLVLAMREGQIPSDIAQDTPLSEYQQMARDKLK